MPWVDARTELASLSDNLVPVSKTGPAQPAAYPFTRPQSDGVWELDRVVDLDKVAQSVLEVSCPDLGQESRVGGSRQLGPTWCMTADACALAGP